MLNIAEVTVSSMLLLTFDDTLGRSVRKVRGEVTSSALGKLSAAESPQRVSYYSWSWSTTTTGMN